MRPKTATEIDFMRAGGKKLAEILQLLSQKVEAGVSGKDIATLAASEIKKNSLVPVLLGFQGYPDVICISVNEAVVHGIPSAKAFAEGDVVKLDLTVGYRGLIIDAATTVVVGSNPTADVRRLVDGTKKALELGISAIHGDGTRVGDIGAAVQNELNKHRLGVVRDLVGHGVGYSVHEDPNIPNYGVAGTGSALPAGLTIAIEPMATLGEWQVGMLPDGWTVVTRDGSLAAHFEHTVLVTDKGAEILTMV